MNEHVVQSGESIWSISRKYNISIDQILSLNPNITDPDKINIGLKIKIPSNGQNKYSKPSNTETIASKTQNPYIKLTENNWRSELAKFRNVFEGFRANAYKDTYKGNNIWTIGTGLTYWIDEDGKETSVKKGDFITEEENQIQLQRRISNNEKIIKKYLPNFDNYPPALKFQISDAMFNVGAYGVIRKSPNYMNALKTYDEKAGWKNKNYPMGDIYKHADWNWNDQKSLGIRSRMRANPEMINPEDYKYVTNPYKWDSLRTVYSRRF